MKGKTFSVKQREQTFSKMQETEYDLVIIGGGITGAGTALDAVLRGMKVALIEMQDFGAGTSSRSTKLIHGGLRYLKQLQIGLVAEVGKERAIVYENGPHITTPERMLLPIYRKGTFGKWSTSLGIYVYDFLAGVKKQERRKMLTANETLEMEPLLKKEGLIGGSHYVEYRTDDARLTIEVIKAAFENGADIANYTKFEDFIYKNSQICGIKVSDMQNGEYFVIQSKIVVNATGPWVDEVRKKDNGITNKRLQLTKGVHIVIDQAKFPLKQAVYFDTPDGRMVFAIPRDGKSYIGTTDTFYNDDPTRPESLPEDRNYLLQAISYMFPSVKLNTDDIESSWAGVRPLIFEEGKDPSEISRRDEIWKSNSGLLTIAGGKLTGYRKMAENVVNQAGQILTKQTERTFANCQTTNFPVSGGGIGGSENLPSFIQQKAKDAVQFGFTIEEGRKLASMYGSNVNTVFQYGLEYYQYKNSSIPRVLFSQLLYSIDHEMVFTPSDFFIRRTAALYFDIEYVKQWKVAVIGVMADILKWTPEQLEFYKTELDISITEATSSLYN